MNSQDWYIILNRGNSVCFKSYFILEYTSVQPVYISSKIVGTVHLFLSQLCNFVYIWCEAPVSEYVLNSCNNFYLKTSLYHFRPQAIQDSHLDSSSQAPANAIYVQPAIDWGQYISSKGCQRWWNSDWYIV